MYEKRGEADVKTNLTYFLPRLVNTLYMKRVYLLIIVFSSCTIGCASLTKSQLDSVNQFAVLSKNYSAYPSRITTELTQIRLERGFYSANALTSDVKSHVDNLDNLYESQTKSGVISQKVDITFKIIDRYAQALQLLSSPSFSDELFTQSRTLGYSIDSLCSRYNSITGISSKIPIGFGSVIGKIILAGGKQYIRVRQAKAVKRFVYTANKLVDLMCDNLIEFATNKNIEQLIQIEADNIPRDFKFYFNAKKQLQTAPLIDDERAYIQLRIRLTAVRTLRDQTLEATKDLKATHKKLVEVLARRTTKQEQVQELQKLYEQVQEVRSTISQIDNNHIKQ